MKTLIQSINMKNVLWSISHHLMTSCIPHVYRKSHILLKSTILLGIITFMIFKLIKPLKWYNELVVSVWINNQLLITYCHYLWLAPNQFPIQKTLWLLVIGYVFSLQPLDLKILKIQDPFNLLEQNYSSQTPGKHRLKNSDEQSVLCRNPI